MNEQLSQLRDRIDAIDEAVLQLLNERARLAQAIGHLKNGTIYRAEREAQVVRRLQGANPGPLPAESISVLFKEIMSACRALEQPLSVAYLGPQGTFSEAATVKHFGHAASNAEAARMAAENPEAAAIAGELAAEHYELKIVARDIEDEPNNTTRFLVLGLEDAAPSGRDKTSLVLATMNRPGSLMELLAPLARHDIGLSKLESRPARNGAWEYVFYVDIDGHRRDPNIKKALHAVEAHCTFLKVLGSYPVAV